MRHEGAQKDKILPLNIVIRPPVWSPPCPGSHEQKFMTSSAFITFWLLQKRYFLLLNDRFQNTDFCYDGLVSCDSIARSQEKEADFTGSKHST